MPIIFAIAFTTREGGASKVKTRRVILRREDSSREPSQICEEESDAMQKHKQPVAVSGKNYFIRLRVLSL